jgi:hypothetical protein
MGSAGKTFIVIFEFTYIARFFAKFHKLVHENKKKVSERAFCITILPTENLYI